MSKARCEVPENKLSLYDSLIATNPEIERKGATMPYTSVNGHMFSFLSKTGRLALRLPKDDRDAFLRKYDTALCVAQGVVMKEYVDVPDDLFARTHDLKPYLDISYEYVRSLKPKPTKRKA